MKNNFQIYKSSAGSGKTTALIHVFLCLSLGSGNPHKFKSILAITFTNKAANELKQRFLTSLKKLKTIDSNETEPDFEVANLARDTGLGLAELKKRATNIFSIALRDYDEIAIGTIDGFNHKLIRSFSRDLRLKSDFEVELDEANLFADAVDLLLEKVGFDPHITYHLLNFLQQSIDDDKRANISGRLNDLRTLITSEESENAVSSLGAIDPSGFVDTKKKLLAKVSSFEKKCREIGERVFEMWDSAGITAGDLSYKDRGYHAFFKKLKDYNGGYVTLNKSLLKSLDKPWFHKSAPAEIKEAVAAMEPDLRDLYGRAERIMYTDYKDYALAKKLNDQIDLLAVLTDLSEEFRQLSRDRNTVPISAFNSIIAKSLRNEPVAYIYEKFGNRYKHLLIDEFQDTSEFQWKNITPFISESLASGQFNMVVGDAKQSIYRWRGGKAEQLIRLPELDPIDATVPSETRASFRRNAEIVHLDTNYRSLPNIVEFNNRLIAELSAVLTEPDSIFRKEYEGASARQNYLESKTGGYIEWRQLEKGAEPELISDQVIQYINNARADGYRYGDMAILVRQKKKEVTEIIEELSDRGIPFTTRDSFGLDMNPTVGMLIAFLRLSLDQDMAPAQLVAMREISRLHGAAFAPQAFWRKKNRTGSIDFSAFLKTVAPEFTIQDLKGESAWQICKFVINTFVPHTLQRAVFIESFLNCILEKGGRSVAPTEFLEWWDSLGEKPEAKTGESGNQVQIMTIHKSKGLQFPVVILPNLNWRFSTRADTKWLPANEKLDLPFDHVPLTFSSQLEEMGYQAELAEHRQENKFDNLNMIYVALTRPSERLYLSHTIGTDSQTGLAVNQAFEKFKEELAKDWGIKVMIDENIENGAESTLRIGEKKSASGGKDEKEGEPVIELSEPVALNVEDRFEISGEGISPNRESGILFHETAAKSQNREEAMDLLSTWKLNGRISSEQAEELAEWLERLFGDERYASLTESQPAMAERTMVHNGEVLRPDLVFKSEKTFTVIDFKTGGEKPEHLDQVERYVLAINQAENLTGEGYVVYVPEMKWVKTEIDFSKQGSLFT